MIEDIKRRALHRTKILQGQLKGLEKMIEAEDYCTDTITQSLAIQKSLSSLNKLLLENHLRTHITDKFTSGEEKLQAEAVKELLDLYELANIRGNS
jgi:DNA-binding FrmR family transcriptional regulator